VLLLINSDDCCWNCYFILYNVLIFFFFSSRRRHTRFSRDWSSDVCSSDLRSLVMKPDSTVSTATFSSVSAKRASSALPSSLARRSEERRVGKECRSGGLRCL